MSHGVDVSSETQVADMTQTVDMTQTNSVIKGIDRLVGDKILIRPKLTREIGGILVPEKAQEEVMFGTVYAVGEGSWKVNKIEGGKVWSEKIPMLVRPGMNVVHDRYGGAPIMIRGEKWLLCKQAEVFGMFSDDWKIESIKMFSRGVLLSWDRGTHNFQGTDILMPDTQRERYFTGDVISAGELALDITVGTRVFWDQFCRPHRIDDHETGKRYAIVQDDDIYCEIPAREEPVMQAAE